MHQRLLRYLFAISLLFASPLASAEGLTTRTFHLPDGSRLQLQAPKPWKYKFIQRPLLPGIAFYLEETGPFQIRLIPMPIHKDAPMSKPSKIKEYIANSAQSMSRQAVEKSIPAMELKGPSVIGYYYTATSMSGETGNRQHRAIGTFRVGDLLVDFGIFTSESEKEIVASALSMLQTTVQIK